MIDAAETTALPAPGHPRRHFVQASPGTALPDPRPQLLLTLISVLAEGETSCDWPRLAELTGQLLQADSCCVVLRQRADRSRLSVSIHGHNGPLPMSARREMVRSGSVIRGLLAELPVTGRGAKAAPVANAPHTIFQPIEVDGFVAGVLHARRDGEPPRVFSDHERLCAELAATLIGNALRSRQMQGLLQSNYAQFALAQGGDGQAERPALADPQGMALRIARSFYRELRKARFDDRHVVAAAGEIIACLSLDLKRPRSVPRTAPQP